MKEGKWFIERIDLVKGRRKATFRSCFEELSMDRRYAMDTNNKCAYNGLSGDLR